MRMQKTIEKIKDKAYKKGYEAAMNKLIEDHKSEKFFYPTGVLAEICGRMSGNVESMRNDELDSLDKKYYADKFAELNEDLKSLRHFMFNRGMYQVEMQADRLVD